LRLLRESHWVRWILISFAAILSWPIILAQGGPPLLTDDPGTPGGGQWEINVAFTLEEVQGERLFEAPLLDLNYGYGDKIQLKFEIPWLILDEEGSPTRSGLGNSEFGVKWRFLDEDVDGLAMSVYPQFEFNNPTSSDERGLVDEGVELLLPVQLQKSLGPISMNGEVGYAIRENHEDEWVYGLALGREFSEGFEFVGEIHGTALRDLGENELVFDIGTRLDLTGILTLLFAAGRSFRGEESGEPQFFTYVGLQFLFE